jgi:hypothetical protein
MYIEGNSKNNKDWENSKKTWDIDKMSEKERNSLHPICFVFLFFFLIKKIHKKKENAEKREDECLENVTVGHKWLYS